MHGITFFSAQCERTRGCVFALVLFEESGHTQIIYRRGSNVVNMFSILKNRSQNHQEKAHPNGQIHGVTLDFFGRWHFVVRWQHGSGQGFLCWHGCGHCLNIYLCFFFQKLCCGFIFEFCFLACSFSGRRLGKQMTVRVPCGHSFLRERAGGENHCSAVPGIRSQERLV